MSEFNPYSAPTTEIGESDPEGGLWRDGKLLVIRKGADLPDRCLKCNEEALGYRLKRNLSWHSSGWYLFLIFNVLIYIIVAQCVRWTGVVHAPICPRHRWKRRRAILLGWIGSLAGILLIAFGAANPEYVICIFPGIILFLVSLLAGMSGSRLAIPKRIDKNYIWLEKVSPDFLLALPDWPVRK